MSNILDNSKKAYGISLKKNPDSIELILNSEKGHGRMVFYAIFEGITLAFIKINAYEWPEDEENLFLKPLLINYCFSGRCELLTDDNTYIYLKKNDYSISQQTAQKKYIFPTGHYEGIKIYFDFNMISKECLTILKYLKIDIFKLCDNYCTKQKTYISNVDQKLREIFLNLWQQYNAPSIFTLQIAIFELLNKLINMRYIPPQPCTFFTEVQVAIAKKTEALITSDLSKRIPIRLIAEKFSISETSLKNYFRGVYGKSISLYLRDIRMEAAEQLLVNTNLSVSEISIRVSYSNQGKFAALFKKHYNLSPLQYRYSKKTENITL